VDDIGRGLDRYEVVYVRNASVKVDPFSPGAHALFAGTALVNILLPAVHPRMGSGVDAAGSTPLLEPPGFLLLNYGRQTAAATIVAHVAYGAIVDGFVSLAG
jgi:hypothetical protein